MPLSKFARVDLVPQDACIPPGRGAPVLTSTTSTSSSGGGTLSAWGTLKIPEAQAKEAPMVQRSTSLSSWGLTQAMEVTKEVKTAVEDPEENPTRIKRQKRQEKVEQASTSMATSWLSRSHNLPEDRRNGWVVSWIFESFQKEEFVTTACNQNTFIERMKAEGLAPLLDNTLGPRAKCKVIEKAQPTKLQLLEESGQRMMLQAISRSLPSYISGIRCWAAFCDSIGLKTHFPAKEEHVIQWSGIFHCSSTYAQYLKHLAFAHRFLRMECTWMTESVKQVKRGASKAQTVIKKKPAVTSRQVRSMIKAAMEEGAWETACLMALARQFLLRVPSEGIPLQWDGTHSKIDLTDSQATITLMRRKHRATPTSMTRECCCASSGRTLCAVHWLLQAKLQGGDRPNVVVMSKTRFAKDVKHFAMKAGIPEWQNLGTHAFRRGMAQDILDAGGNLAVLLRAGDWSSAAFLHYLRESQTQDVAVGHTIINLSDSDAE